MAYSGAASASYGGVTAELNAVRQLISGLAACQAPRFGWEPQRSSIIKTTACGPSRRQRLSSNRCKIARGAELQNGFFRSSSELPYPSLPEKRDGVIQIRKQILLRNSKGEGETAPRASRPDSVVSGTARKFIRAVRHMSSYLARRQQRPVRV